MTDLIDLHDQLDYCAFEDEPLNCYQLSNYQLVFAGRRCDPGEFAAYADPHAPHTSDIYDHSIYLPVRPNAQLHDGLPKYRCLTVGDFYWRHMVPYGAEVAIVGYCKVWLGVTQVNLKAFEKGTDLRDLAELAKVAVVSSRDNYNGNPAFIYPASTDDLIQHNIKGRPWLQVNEGCYEIDREYHFMTALTEEHFFSVIFQPRQHWEQGTDPSDAMLAKVFRSFWDFMDNLNITELASDGDGQVGVMEPGTVLRGKDAELAASFSSAQDYSESDSGW